VPTHRPTESEEGAPTRDGKEEALSSSGGSGTEPVEAAPAPVKRGRGRPKGSKSKLPRQITDQSKPAVSTTVANWLATRAMFPTMSNRDIAAKMGIPTPTLYKALERARAQGKLDLHEPLDQLKYQIIPKAVTNLEKLLDANDKTATLETMKGTLFKVYQASEGAQEMPNLVLGIKIEMPEGYDQTKVIQGTIVGKPRELKD
jgi:hypothetical protein